VIAAFAAQLEPDDIRFLARNNLNHVKPAGLPIKALQVVRKTFR
jgi:hypothetical protein